MERSEGLAKDIEWLGQQGFVIPEPSNPGNSYAKYLEELSEKSAPLFLCHFYNIYFSHIAGGQVIARQVYASFSHYFVQTGILKIDLLSILHVVYFTKSYPKYYQIFSILDNI